VVQAQHAERKVHVSPAVEGYLVSLIRATREHDTIELGASPRATLALYHTAQAYAAIKGRGFVLPDDEKRMVGPGLSHRIILSTRTRLRGRDSAGILEEVVESVPVPVESRT